MTSFETADLNSYPDQPEAIAHPLFLDGKTDAAFGQLPRRKDDAYLTGYLAGIRELPTNTDGSLQHYSPRQHFAFGLMDSPDPCHCEDY